MTPSKPPSAEAAVLQANAAFYRAFSRGDFAAMRQVWAESAPLACIHPGAPAIRGRDEVLESWKQILRGSTPLHMRCDRSAALLFGEVAVVTCYEGNGNHPAHLAATNVFILERGEWRMVHHQAGPLSMPLPGPSAASMSN